METRCKGRLLNEVVWRGLYGAPPSASVSSDPRKLINESEEVMAVWITVDEMDGTSKVRGPFEPDEVNLMGLLLRLNTRQFASVTFTRANPLNRLEENNHDQ